MDSYRTPSGDGEAGFEEKKSKFTGRVFLCDTEGAALAHIERLKKEFWDATHNVYAYSVREGPTRYSDDGEPQGTAGVPVLDVFRKAEITNFCCVVTRYFGGTLLGAGGLVRAYGTAAKLALDAAGVSEMRPGLVFLLAIPYPLFEQVKREIALLLGDVISTDYADDVTLTLWLPEENADTFSRRVGELSSGGCAPVFVENRYYPTRIG
ncbi:IMPACT family protein [Oscillospiraceae bacterium OttesenSCG-928-G22]|nr:IMPACT family protein [Oscillospiraceae bacterium OttesenSCG-928-G22]